MSLSSVSASCTTELCGFFFVYEPPGFYLVRLGVGRRGGGLALCQVAQRRHSVEPHHQHQHSRAHRENVVAPSRNVQPSPLAASHPDPGKKGWEGEGGGGEERNIRRSATSPLALQEGVGNKCNGAGRRTKLDNERARAPRMQKWRSDGGGGRETETGPATHMVWESLARDMVLLLENHWSLADVVCLALQETRQACTAISSPAVSLAANATASTRVKLEWGWEG